MIDDLSLEVEYQLHAAARSQIHDNSSSGSKRNKFQEHGRDFSRVEKIGNEKSLDEEELRRS